MSNPWADKVDETLIEHTALLATHSEMLTSHKETSNRIESVANNLARKIEEGFTKMEAAVSSERKIKDFLLILAFVVIIVEAMTGHVPSGISLPK